MKRLNNKNEIQYVQVVYVDNRTGTRLMSMRSLTADSRQLGRLLRGDVSTPVSRFFHAEDAANRDIAQHAVRYGTNTNGTYNMESRRVYRMTNSRSADAVFTGMVTA